MSQGVMHKRPSNLSATLAKQRLCDGHERYRANRPEAFFHQNAKRESSLKDQQPYAVVLTCSDSRVCPEVVFDAGIGQVFTICIAGNIVDQFVTASVEYACLYLGVNLVVVLGHQHCGAVQAALDGLNTECHLDALLDKIKTTIKFSDQDTNVDVEQCIRVHAIAGARTLVSSKPVLSMLGDQGLQILPAFYHLKDGQVEWLAES
jgi:carbonic anhydrase